MKAFYGKEFNNLYTINHTNNQTNQLYQNFRQYTGSANNIKEHNYFNQNKNQIINNINNNNNLNNNIVPKKINNNQMNDNFKIIYNILFKTTNNIEYTLAVNGRKKMDKFIQMYENIMIKNEELQFFYCGKKIEIVPPVYNFLEKNNDNFSTFDYFRNDKNPVIIVKDEQKLIRKLIYITYYINNGEKFSLIFNKLKVF